MDAATKPTVGFDFRQMFLDKGFGALNEDGTKFFDAIDEDEDGNEILDTVQALDYDKIKEELGISVNAVNKLLEGTHLTLSGKVYNSVIEAFDLDVAHFRAWIRWNVDTVNAWVEAGQPSEGEEGWDPKFSPDLLKDFDNKYYDEEAEALIPDQEEEEAEEEFYSGEGEETDEDDLDLK